MGLQVIGAGYGRTGTTSLKAALEILGYDACYHMNEWTLHPEHYRHWLPAFEGKEVNWNSLFEGYRAAIDLPVAAFYKKLANHYPKAKVILTIRDPESWYESARATIFSFKPPLTTQVQFALARLYSQRARDHARSMRIIRKNLFGQYFEGKIHDKTYCIEKFLQHIETVKKEIDLQRLLVYEVKEGWGPLCHFLGKPVPQIAFPSSNHKGSFAQNTLEVMGELLKK